MVSVMSESKGYKRKNVQEEGVCRPGFQRYKVHTLGLPGKLCKQKTKC